MLSIVKDFLSPAYLFNKNLGPFVSRLAWLFLGGVILVMIAAWLVRAKLVKSRDIFAKKTAKKFFNLTLTMGSLTVVLWGFRQTNVLYLSAPILLLAAALMALIWLGFVIYYWKITAPCRRAQLSQESQRRRYLP